eukprot:5589137-Prymnesium_polylepis.1
MSRVIGSMLCCNVDPAPTPVPYFARATVHPGVGGRARNMSQLPRASNSGDGTGEHERRLGSAKRTLCEGWACAHLFTGRPRCSLAFANCSLSASV